MPSMECVNARPNTVLRGPIVITGTFKKPSVRPDMRKLAARGGLAAGLGAMTGGIGALLPLLEFGKKRTATAPR